MTEHREDDEPRTVLGGDGHDPLHEGGRPGDDVGGPASTFQSGVEDTLASPAEDDQPDSQARNPL